MKPLSTIASPRYGFTLVEMSIVLVVLGLLIGSVMGAQALIRASAMRSIITEYQRYTGAVNNFRDKYQAIPGDMSTATSVWGKDNANCPGDNGNFGWWSFNTCNGNGDGMITAAGAVSTPGEAFEFWRQLEGARLIEGDYTGLAGPTGGWTGMDSVIGTNVPKSKLKGGGWSVAYKGNDAGDSKNYAATINNILVVGAVDSGTITDAALFSPEEAWGIDTKLDDGVPGTGIAIAVEGIGFSTANPCTTSANKTDYAGTYKISNTTISCAIRFVNAF